MTFTSRLAAILLGSLMDANLPSRSDELLRRLQSWLSPINNLKFANDGSYSEAAVRWLISPQVDEARSIFDLGAERTVSRVDDDLGPLEASVTFLPGHRYRDARADVPRNAVEADSLITGSPSLVEKPSALEGRLGKFRRPAQAAAGACFAKVFICAARARWNAGRASQRAT